MTAKYVRLARGYEYLVTQDEVTGSEQYLRDDNHAAGVTALPVVGSTQMLNGVGSAVPACLCRSEKTVYLDGDMNTPIYDFKFSTNKGGGGSPGKNIGDPSQRRFQLGTEVVSVEMKGGTSAWYWNGGSKVNQAIHRMTIIGEFAVPVKKTAAEINAWMASVISLVGCVNSAAFTGDAISQFPIGNVLFTGISGGTKTDDEGATEWAFDMNFAFRIIPGISSLSWEYIWDEVRNTWGIPAAAAVPGSTDYLYHLGTIQALVT